RQADTYEPERILPPVHVVAPKCGSAAALAAPLKSSAQATAAARITARRVTRDTSPPLVESPARMEHRARTEARLPGVASGDKQNMSGCEPAPIRHARQAQRCTQDRRRYFEAMASTPSRS